MIIADTTVVSEFLRDTPDPVVLKWAQSIDASDLSICVVTVEEIERRAAPKRNSARTAGWSSVVSTQVSLVQVAGYVYLPPYWPSYTRTSPADAAGDAQTMKAPAVSTTPSVPSGGAASHPP